MDSGIDSEIGGVPFLVASTSVACNDVVRACLSSLSFEVGRRCQERVPLLVGEVEALEGDLKPIEGGLVAFGVPGPRSIFSRETSCGWYSFSFSRSGLSSCGMLDSVESAEGRRSTGGSMDCWEVDGIRAATFDKGESLVGEMDRARSR